MDFTKEQKKIFSILGKLSVEKRKNGKSKEEYSKEMSDMVKVRWAKKKALDSTNS